MRSRLSAKRPHAIMRAQTLDDPVSTVTDRRLDFKGPSVASPPRACLKSAGRVIRDHYFGIPTNKAPVNLPSAPMSGA
jgi:hypothetical protein